MHERAKRQKLRKSCKDRDKYFKKRKSGETRKAKRVERDCRTQRYANIGGNALSHGS
jgi:hypothetical protein